jgi:hypothetical protein
MDISDRLADDYMTRIKTKKLTKLGYRITTTREFLGLSSEEMVVIELKLVMIGKLKSIQSKKGNRPARL